MFFSSSNNAVTAPWPARTANARRAKEEERTDRPVRVLDAGTAAVDTSQTFSTAFILTDNALVERIIQMQQFLTLAFHQFGNRMPVQRATIRGRFLPRSPCRAAACCRSWLPQRSSPVQPALLEAAAACRISARRRDSNHNCALASRDFAASTGFISSRSFCTLPMEFFSFSHRAFMALNCSRIGQLFLNDAQRSRARHVLLLRAGLLDFMLHDAAAHVVQLLRHGIHLGANGRTGLIHQVDGLIRQKTIRNIAIGERRGGDQRLIGDFNAVEDLVTPLSGRAEWRSYPQPSARRP